MLEENNELKSEVLLSQKKMGETARQAQDLEH